MSSNQQSEVDKMSAIITTDALYNSLAELQGLATTFAKKAAEYEKQYSAMLKKAHDHQDETQQIKRELDTLKGDNARLLDEASAANDETPRLRTTNAQLEARVKALEAANARQHHQGRRALPATEAEQAPSRGLKLVATIVADAKTDLDGTLGRLADAADEMREVRSEVEARVAVEGCDDDCEGDGECERCGEASEVEFFLGQLVDKHEALARVRGEWSPEKARGALSASPAGLKRGREEGGEGDGSPVGKRSRRG